MGSGNISRKHFCCNVPSNPLCEKLIYTRYDNILSGNLQSLNYLRSPIFSIHFVHRAVSPLNQKIGSTEIFATSLLHSLNGSFVTVVDNEYIIFTSLSWRNKSFGNGISFAWHLIHAHMLWVKSNLKYTGILENSLELRWKVREVERWRVVGCWDIA